MEKGNLEEQENLWNKILSEAVNNQARSDANILVVGERNSGKRSLISAMEKFTGGKLNLESKNEKSIVHLMKDKKIASAIDYRYFSIKNPDDENMELAKINLWFLEETADKSFIDLILKKENMKNFMVMLVLNFEEYWNTTKALSKWLEFINTKIAPDFSSKLDLDEGDRLRSKLKDIVMNYTEPHKTEGGKILNRKSEIDPDNAENLFIPKGVLESNSGFPIVLVMNKADYILEIRKQQGADKILEMMEYTLRKYAVSYASPIAYTSIKMNTNIEVLYDYLNHLLFGLTFIHESNINKDTLFIPMGYDNLDIINESFAGIKDEPFEKFISAPKENTKEEEIAIQVKQHQIFLGEIKATLGSPRKKAIKSSGKSSSGTRTGKGRVKPGKGDKEAKKTRGYDKDKTQKILSLLSKP